MIQDTGLLTRSKYMIQDTGLLTRSKYMIQDTGYRITRSRILIKSI